MKRCDLRKTPYDPRIIDPYSRKKLKEKIQQVGLVETLVYNKRTGNLVGGNQRISILDDLEQNDQYELDVAVIDVDEGTEKELVVFLNNQSAMGAWDTELLEQIARDKQVDIRKLGFDEADLQILLDGADLSPIFDEEKRGNASKHIKTIEEMKAERKRYKNEVAQKQDSEFYLVLVFSNRREVEEFQFALHQDPQQRYIDGKRLAMHMGLDLDALTGTSVSTNANES